MKQGILTIVLIASISAAAFAGNPTKAENDAAIKKGHKELAVKTDELENNLKDHNSIAFQNDVSAVLDLMHRRMDQEKAAINLEPGITPKVAADRFNTIEMIVYQYMKLAKDPASNGQQLVNHARAFLSRY